MELVPSRYNEMPTLIPAFEKNEWQRIKYTDMGQTIGTKIRDMVCVHIHTFYIPELKKIMNSIKDSREAVGRLIITTSIRSKEKLEELKGK